jgi:spore cortex formation protein SpoVR/YcgB (stage V sporulation)
MHDIAAADLARVTGYSEKEARRAVEAVLDAKSAMDEQDYARLMQEKVALLQAEERALAEEFGPRRKGTARRHAAFLRGTKRYRFQPTKKVGTHTANSGGPDQLTAKRNREKLARKRKLAKQTRRTNR